LSDIPKDKFKGSYYDSEYYVGLKGGKSYRSANGELKKWSYFNPTGQWLGCKDITEAWNQMFSPSNILDVGCGRGQMIAYARDLGIEAVGFDFSEWAIGDEGRYGNTKKEWVKYHDATEEWPYPDNNFDLVIALDIYEHIYEDDLKFVISEMYRVSRKWVFLQIATAGSGGLQGEKEKGYILKKNQSVPLDLQGCAVAGHVTVINEEAWYNWLDNENWLPRRDMVNWFISLVPNAIIRNWMLNTIIIMEKF